jgi:hypothetical protein
MDRPRSQGPVGDARAAVLLRGAVRAAEHCAPDFDAVSEMRHPQCEQVGAIACTAHSKVSNVLDSSCPG